MHWQNAKLLLSLFFPWAPELLVCTCLLLSQTLFWEKTTQSRSWENIFGSCKYKQIKNITDVKPYCVVKMNVSGNRLLLTKPTGVLHPSLGPPAQDTHEVRAAPGKWLKAWNTFPMRKMRELWCSSPWGDNLVAFQYCKRAYKKHLETLFNETCGDKT